MSTLEMVHRNVSNGLSFASLKKLTSNLETASKRVVLLHDLEK